MTTGCGALATCAALPVRDVDVCNGFLCGGGSSEDGGVEQLGRCDSEKQAGAHAEGDEGSRQLP
jgi:hypothetical protein